MKTEIFLHESLKSNRVKNLKPKYNLHSYVNAEGTSQIIMILRANGEREQIPMGFYCPKSKWDKKSQRLNSSANNAEKINVLLDKAIGRIADIRINYALADRPLSLQKLVEEYKNATPNYDFIAFMKYQLSKMPMKDSSRAKHEEQIRKLQLFKNEILFTEVNIELIEHYKHFLFTVRDNNPNTISASMKIIKKFIKKALKYGIRINIELDDIKVGSIRGNRVNLTLEEVEKLKEYYNSKFIRDAHKLPLGYFLFSCYTGLRFQDVLNLDRRDLQGSTFTFVAEKNTKRQSLPLNNSAKLILESYPKLFVKKISNQKTNKFLKEIAKICGIRKNLHFHIARHTFATNFLRLGGKVEELQILLDHAKIETTMIYVHMVRAEKIENIHLFDKKINSKHQ